MALLLTMLCVLANGFFVAAEFALVKVRATSLEASAKAGDKRSQRALAIHKQLDAYLTATQLGITLASLGLGWVGEPALAALLRSWIHPFAALPDHVAHWIAFVIAFATLSLLHIVLGELVPKSLALQKPETIARFSAGPMRGFFFLVYPALWFLNICSNVVLRAMRLPQSEYAEGVLSADELGLIIQASAQGGSLDEKKRELLQRVLAGTDRPVRNIMVPRVDVVTLSLKEAFEASLTQVQRHGFSRYPVSEDGNPDQITGYVYVKDLIMATARPREGMRALKRDILFVPETRTVSELLSDFQRTKIPIAIVVDEYGGTAGLATLEDTVEEIVGEIQDELDVETPRVQARADGTVVVDGSLPTAEIQIEGLVLPPLDGGETIGGYVVAALGRLAHPGDRVRFGEFIAIVEDVRRRRVWRVAFLRQPPTMPPPTNGHSSTPPPDAEDRTSTPSGS